MSSDSRGKDNKSSLAHRAQQKYNAGKYIEAIDALQKLSEEIAPERDVKVQHNLVVAGYVSHKYTTREFEQHLRNLLATLTENENEPTKRTNSEETMAFTTCSFVRYNLAASLFQQKQYAAASSVLEVLLRNVEPMDENVAMHVCFLYLDIILHSSRACISTERERQVAFKRAQSILSYLEKPHGFNGQGMTSVASEEKIIDGTSGESKKDDADVIEFRFRLHLYKAKLMLLQSNLKIAKKEVKSALEIFQKEIRSRTDDVGSADKTSTSIGHPSLAVQKTTGLFLKANLEYLRSNHKKCLKLLASCVQQAVDESIFLNNMGCIHFQMGQRKAAHSYFARALEASTKTRKSTQESAVVLSTSSQYEIMYNNGLQLLLQGDYALAFRCFHVSSRIFFNRPKLWLRMGECCTAAYAQQSRHAATAGNKSGLIQGIIGSGSHRRVLLPTTQLHSGVDDIEIPDKLGRNNCNNTSATSNTSGLNDTPKMNLPFAAKCFKNAILLCHQLLECVKETTSEVESDLERTEALDLLRQKALINLTYVYLSMYEPQLAITNAKELLRLPTCTKSNRFLARSYGAEALCMLSRAQEATQVLQAERDMMNLADEYSKEAKSNPKQARAAVYVNNATTLILHGKVAEAEESVSRAVSESTSCRESLKLLVYFYLTKGDTKKALRVLKEAQVVV